MQTKDFDPQENDVIGKVFEKIVDTEKAFESAIEFTFLETQGGVRVDCVLLFILPYTAIVMSLFANVCVCLVSTFRS